MGFVTHEAAQQSHFVLLKRGDFQSAFFHDATLSNIRNEKEINLETQQHEPDFIFNEKYLSRPQS